MTQPTYCSVDAFQLFRSQLPRQETNEGLVMSAIAIAMHAFEDVRPWRVRRQLRHWSARIMRRTYCYNPRARLAHLHELLYEDIGLHGAPADCVSPLNVFLPLAMESRRGLPETLGLIYKTVAEPAGLTVHGLESPDSFYVHVSAGSDRLIVDPRDGRLVTEPELRLSHQQHAKARRERPNFYLRTVSHRRWIQRMLRGVLAFLAQGGWREDFRAMLELVDLLDELADEAS